MILSIRILFWTLFIMSGILAGIVAIAIQINFGMFQNSVILLLLSILWTCGLLMGILLNNKET